MTEAIRVKIAEEVSNKELVSNNVKPTSICGFFLKTGKCYRTNCKFSHKINTEDKSEELIQLNSKKKISEENLRKRQGNSEFINSATNATEIKQIVASEMSGEKNTVKEETRKRSGDRGLCFISLTENNSRDHYAGKPHKKHPNNYTCSLCKVTTTSEGIFKQHLNGKPHAKKLRLTTLVERNKASFICEVCGVKTVDNKSLDWHLLGPEHRGQVAKKEKGNKSGSEQTKAYIEKGLNLVSIDEKDTEKIEIMSNKRKIKVEVEETQKAKVEVYCLLCQIYGHISEECAPRVRCLDCGIKGHIRREYINSESENEYVEKEIPKDEPNNDVKLESDSNATGIKKDMTTSLNMSQEYMEDKKKIKLEVYCILCQTHDHIFCDACVSNAICDNCGVKGHVRRDCKKEKCDLKNIELEVKKET